MFLKLFQRLYIYCSYNKSTSKKKVFSSLQLVSVEIFLVIFSCTTLIN